MKKRTLCLLLLNVLLAACASGHETTPSPETIFVKNRIVGIWQIAPLSNGDADVIEFTEDGKRRLYTFNCISSAAGKTETGRYTVEGRQLNLSADGIEQSFRVLYLTPDKLALIQETEGKIFQFLYHRSDKVMPLCGWGKEWAVDALRRTPFSPSDFDANPYIPQNKNIERYVGKWADEKGRVQIEVLQEPETGKFLLKLEPSENWKHLYSSIVWLGDELHFRSFAYSEKPELFDNSYHKSEAPNLLSPLPDRNQIKWKFFVRGESSEFTLTRKQ